MHIKILLSLQSSVRRVYCQGAACSAEKLPAELERSFQNIFDDPQFMQWSLINIIWE